MSSKSLNPRSKRVRHARELLFRVVYAIDIGQMDKNDAFATCRTHFFDQEVPDHPGAKPAPAPDEATAALAEEWVKSMTTQWEKVDEVAQKASKRWKLDRMQPMDRNILRVGVFQLLETELPPKDVIYDCVELAKAWAGEKTPGFINGVLDQVCQENGISL